MDTDSGFDFVFKVAKSLGRIYCVALIPEHKRDERFVLQFRHFRRVLEDILIPGIEMNSRTLAGTSIGQPLMQGKCLEKILLTGRRVRDILIT